MGAKRTKGEVNLDGVNLPKSKAVISHKEIAATDHKVSTGNYWLKRAGEATRPPGSRHVGSVAIHYYVETLEMQEHVYHIATQHLIDNVPEGLCDQGVKQTINALKRKYGRLPN